jgi:phage gp16-like protein
MAFHGINIKPSHKGLLHKDLGKKPGAKLSAADLAKAKRSKNPAERRRATFAQNARKWNHGKARKSRAESLYGSK